MMLSMKASLRVWVCLLVVARARADDDDDGASGCLSPSRRGLPYCNASLPASARAADLASRLTDAERLSLLSTTAPSIARLGIPPYEMWNEGLHGVGTVRR